MSDLLVTWVGIRRSQAGHFVLPIRPQVLAGAIVVASHTFSTRDIYITHLAVFVHRNVIQYATNQLV